MPAEMMLQNVILSTNPCPICKDANGRTMSYEDWANSEWGLPGSSARYCEDACHCILVPVDALPELPEISKMVKLRGEDGSEIKAVVDIFPKEQGLKEIMDEWNDELGKLPDEIYDMDVMKVEAYLRKRFATLRSRK